MHRQPAATSSRSRARRTCPTACCGRSTRPRSTTAVRTSRSSASRSRRPPAGLPTRPGRRLPGLRHRRVGGGARQHAVARRQRDRVRDRPLRDAVAGDGASARARRRVARGRLASRRRPERIADACATTTIRAVMVVHNETSTGVTSRIPDIRAAMGDHDALLLVDTISSLGSIDYRHEEWGVDVTVGGSQKGLMLPRGAELQRRLGEGARGPERAAAPLVLGLGADHRRQRGRLLALHVGHQPALRAARGARDAARGEGSRTSSPATPATPRRRVPRCTAGAWRCWRSTSASTRRR